MQASSFRLMHYQIFSRAGTVARLLAVAIAMATLTCTAPAAEKAKSQATYPTIGSIERIDPRFDKLIDKDAKVEKLAEGFAWAEGPCWVPQKHYLLFSDIPNNRIMKWQEGDTEATVYLKPSGYTGTKPRGGETGSNALTLDHEGRLVFCQHGDRRIARQEKDGTITGVVERYEGKRFNSPNDLIYKSNGDLYFTDPPYGLAKNWDDPERELDFCGLFRYSADGKLTAILKDLTRPNGLAFSPDEKTLYVAVSDPAKPVIMAYDVRSDGTVEHGRVFYDTSKWWAEKKKGLPDGMKVDQDGNLFATGPGGLHIYTPDGTHLGVIDTGEKTANCAWGDDGSTLYLCADMCVCRIKTKTKGNGWK